MLTKIAKLKCSTRPLHAAKTLNYLRRKTDTETRHQGKNHPAKDFMPKD